MSKTLREKIRQLPPRLLFALGCYLVLVLVGLFIFLPVRSREDQILFALFLAIFAILAVKTIVHSKRGT